MSDSVPLDEVGSGAATVVDGQFPASVESSRVRTGVVFISHEKSDEGLAREIRSHLETGGLACWMAPDDIRGPTPWPEQVEHAIETCDVMLIIVSQNSGSSRHVSREVDLAVELGKPLLPVRVEDVAPTGTLNYLLRLAQWIDLFPGPIADHAASLHTMVNDMLTERHTTRPPSPPPAEPQHPRRWPRIHVPKGVLIALGAAAILAIGVGIGLIVGNSSGGDEAADPTAEEPVPTATEEVTSQEPEPILTEDSIEATADPEPTAPATTTAPPVGKGTITRISVATDGSQGNDHSFYPSISADGRYVTFQSHASNLVADDSIAPEYADHIYLHDRETGETIRLSQVVYGDRVESGDEGSSRPVISGNGSYVVFESYANNLDQDYSERSPGFVHLLELETSTNRVISLDPIGGQHPGNSEFPDVSDDGTLVAYGMRSGVDQTTYSVWVHDVTTATTTRLAEFYGVDARYPPSISVVPDGAFVWASGPIGGGTYVYERATGVVTEMADLRNMEVSYLVAFPDGDSIAFTSANPLIPRDVNAIDDAYSYSRSTGEFTRLLESSDERSARPSSVSADGRYIAMVGSVNLIMDLQDGSTYEIDPSLGLDRLILSGDGKWATFNTTAPAVGDDTNGRQDVFVIQLQD